MLKNIPDQILEKIHRENRSITEKTIKATLEKSKTYHKLKPGKTNKKLKRKSGKSIIPFLPKSETDFPGKVPSFANNPIYIELITYIVSQTEKGIYPDIGLFAQEHGITRSQAHTWIVHPYTSYVFDEIIREKIGIGKLAIAETVLARRSNPRFAQIWLDYYEQRGNPNAQGNISITIQLTPPQSEAIDTAQVIDVSDADADAEKTG